MRLLRGNKKRELIDDVVQNRGQYAVFITLLAAMLVLGTSSVLVLQFESRDPGAANIDTGGDALWWALVTITTVGYGDFFPVTSLGRLTGVFVMFAGVGIIGALASILASILVPPAKDTTVADAAATKSINDSMDAVAAELANLRAEVAAMRATLSGGATVLSGRRASLAGQPGAATRMWWRPRGSIRGLPVTGSGTTSQASPKTSATRPASTISAGGPAATIAPSFIAMRWSA